MEDPLRNPQEGAPLEGLKRLVARLRGKDGCPWDRAQTAQSLIIYLIEESYELLEAVEARDPESISEELGDVLFHIVFLARLFEEEGAFDLDDVARNNIAKMVHRHPHVFGSKRLQGQEQVRAQWQKLKAQEKGPDADSSLIDGVPARSPALLRAHQLSERAGRIGFDWPNLGEVLAKADEEWAELKSEVEKQDIAGAGRELGDVFFTLVNVARFLRIHPETALSASIRKFGRRFRYMEQAARQQGLELADVSRDALEALWDESKAKGI